MRPIQYVTFILIFYMFYEAWPARPVRSRVVGAVCHMAVVVAAFVASRHGRHPIAPPPAVPPQAPPPAATDDESFKTGAAAWAKKEQAVLDECKGWIAGTRGTWTLAPKSAVHRGGFTSQYRQDKYVWKTLFNGTTSNRLRDGRPRVYADVAANHYKSISNSYFFDRCLHWRGVCVEPNPVYHADLRAERTCSLIPTCVSNHTTEIEMRLPNDRWHGARGGATSSHFVQGRHVDGTKPVMKRCVRLQDEFDRLDIKHIDVLFLDLEGYEDLALRGIDFGAMRIDHVLCESTCDPMLTAHGYQRIDYPRGLVADAVWQRADLATSTNGTRSQ